MKKKISVVIPVYNVQEYIFDCIESVVKQTLKDIEIIIVDDGSKDESINIVKKFTDDRIKIITKKNGGLSSARNEGLRYCNGEYILFIDSDDFLTSNKALEELYELGKKGHTDIVVGNGTVYYSQLNNEPIYRGKDIFSYRNISSNEFLIEYMNGKCMYAGVWLNLYKKTLFDNDMRFKEGILHEDEEFTPRIFLKAERVAIYPKEFYAYRQRAGSITKSKDLSKNSEDLIETVFSLEILYKTIEDDKLKKLMLDNLVTLFLSAMYMCKKKKMPKESKKFLIKNSYSLKNKCKSITFMLSKNMYYYLNDISKNR